MRKLHINSNDNYIPMVTYMPLEPRPGYAYVPYQTNPMYFNNITEAFISGTIFPELVTPYLEFFQSEVDV
jgi:hypothetical protein